MILALLSTFARVAILAAIVTGLALSFLHGWPSISASF